MFLPNYRAFVVVFLAGDLSRDAGSSSSAPSSVPTCVPPPSDRIWCRAFGIDVPRMITLTYGFGVGLAALAGVLAAPAIR